VVSCWLVWSEGVGWLVGERSSMSSFHLVSVLLLWMELLVGSEGS
jgi:hypothetical protein